MNKTVGNKVKTNRRSAGQTLDQDMSDAPSLVGRRTVSLILNKRLAAIIRSPVKSSLKPKRNSR